MKNDLLNAIFFAAPGGPMPEDPPQGLVTAPLPFNFMAPQGEA